jgi:hypothetical protein
MVTRRHTTRNQDCERLNVFSSTDARLLMRCKAFLGEQSALFSVPQPNFTPKPFLGFFVVVNDYGASSFDILCNGE